MSLALLTFPNSFRSSSFCLHSGRQIFGPEHAKYVVGLGGPPHVPLPSHPLPYFVRAHFPYRHILCAIEPGMESAHIVKTAEKLAVAYRASLALVSAIEWPTDNPAIDSGNYRDRIRETAEAELLRDSPTLLIVGRGESQSPLSGVLSNLYSIVRESPCPVLSV